MPSGIYVRQKNHHGVCAICGTPFNSNNSKRKTCDNKECKYKYQVRNRYGKIYIKNCCICGDQFETRNNKRTICRKESCTKEKRKTYNSVRTYKQSKITQPPEIKLVDSICPFCRKKHKGESKWEYCEKHIYLRFNSDYASSGCRLF